MYKFKNKNKQNGLKTFHVGIGDSTYMFGARNKDHAITHAKGLDGYLGDEDVKNIKEFK